LRDDSIFRGTNPALEDLQGILMTFKGLRKGTDNMGRWNCCF
jgi:hypothetical protein